MKSQFFLFFLIILQSCQSDLLTDNKPIIEKIDKLNFNKTIYEVSIDSNENVIDTLSIEKIKTDENGKIAYEYKESWNEGRKFIQQSYYRINEDLFYQISDYGNGEVIINYETFVNKDNVIDRAQMVSIKPKSPDTTFLKYNFSYNSKGKKDSLKITSILDSIDSMTFMKFNDDEKLELRYLIVNRDTIEKDIMKYVNGNIIKSSHEFAEPFRIDLYEFDDYEIVKSRKTFEIINDSLKMSKEYIYENDNSGNPEKIIIKDFEKDTILQRRLITAHNTSVNAIAD